MLSTVATAVDLGLLPEEFESIEKILGRNPNFTELAIFSAMWSEHCSYKNSIFWLKMLPKEGPRILVKAGEENAGLVDLGDGIGCVFKIESHNHPSAFDPYQGAATGVGGINRDIFTMGARPIAQLNALCFGNPSLEHSKWIMKGVVKGIAFYGNALGVPTVGGSLFFDPCYRVNPLVNVLSVGIVKIGHAMSAIAYGVGNLVCIVGALTGKDGIHGAAFASRDTTENLAHGLPAGDPFQEKLLLEATLEVIKTGAIVGTQDVGAAGIVCSCSEMSAKGKHGMTINLEKVPVRQHGMQPYEILLSESQERMLFVIQKGREKEVIAVFDKWDLNYAIIGEVINDKRLRYYMHGTLVVDVPVDDLVLGGGAPVYQRTYLEPAYYKKHQQFHITSVTEPEDLKSVAEHLLTHPNIASKNWVSDQYDSMVGVATMTTNRPSDAAVIHIKGSNKAIALTVDCHPRYVYANPEKGCAIAVAEAARNIVCAGGEPVAVTNCLNFGNPYIPEVYWQFVAAIKGMKQACHKFQTPVTGGNVSFYNQSPEEGPILPTPVIGMLGVLDDLTNLTTSNFKHENDLIYLIGESVNDLASSQYLASYHKILDTPAPYFDIDKECTLHQIIKKLIHKRILQSAHDVADGGLYIALVESALPNSLGFSICTDPTIRKDAFLFGEAQSRVVVSIQAEQQAEFLDMLTASEVPFRLLGTVTPENIYVDAEFFGTIQEITAIHNSALANILEE